MKVGRAILFATVILAGPVAIFCVLGALPFGYISWLGGGFIGIVLVMAVPGIACIAMLGVARWQRAIAAIFYLTIYCPACLFPGVTATCMLSGCNL